MTVPMTSSQWVAHLMAVLDDKKAENIQSFHVNSMFADYFVVVTALSSRHLWSLCEAVEKECKSHKIRPLSHGKNQNTRRGEEPQEIRWIVIDAGGVLIHLFSPEGREYYALEKLWSGKEPDPSAELSHSYTD